MNCVSGGGCAAVEFPRLGTRRRRVWWGTDTRHAHRRLSRTDRRAYRAGWKTLGSAQCFGTEVAPNTDACVVCGRAPAEAMRVSGRADYRTPADAGQRVQEPLLTGARGSGGVFRYCVGRNTRRDTGLD